MCELDRVWSDFELCRPKPEPELKIMDHADYICEHCGGAKQYDVFDDLPVCTGCGRVDYQFVCEEPEWRSGGDECKADPSRVGAPVNTDHFSAAWGSSTIMSVAKQASYQQKRLAMINLHTSMNHKDRALFHAYQDLDKVGKQILGLPDSVMYQVKIKYKAFNEAVLTRGAVRNGIKANCVFQACRECGVSRTTKEIADAFGIPARDLSRTFDMYQEQLPETEVHVTGSEGSQLVADVFSQISRDRNSWLDVCAGPGGKAALLAAIAKNNEIEFSANEISDVRAKLVRQVVQGALVTTLDAREIASLQKTYGAILADVPCTGLGALRRRPEVRWRRSVADLKSLVVLQSEIIDASISVLEPGGIFGYATCSPHLSETRIAVSETLKRHPEMEVLDVSPYLHPNLRETGVDRGSLTLWTHRHNTDAMFLSVMRKKK